MKFELLKDSVIMKDGVLAGFETLLTEESVAFNKEAALQLMRDYPRFAAELLSYGRREIVYMGKYADRPNHEGRTLGVRILSDGITVEGDNSFGEFLSHVADAYREELRQTEILEEPVRPGQVICDFTPSGEVTSNVEEREQNGEEFIHTDPYYGRFRVFDAAKDGTTGHNQRLSDKDVPFHTFVNPFGTARGSKVIVGSAAEASLLYERALRGELDFRQLFDSLEKRGLLPSRMDAVQRKSLITDLEAQFAWMREDICKNLADYQRMPIVTKLELIPDSSMGRSIYDPVYAPSPAYILAHYINNPLQLFSGSEMIVSRALEINDKREPFRLGSHSSNGKISVLIDGSDTIGGRVPGTRAVKAMDIQYERDEKNHPVYDNYGRKVIKSQTEVFKFKFKPSDEIESDYEAFKQRLDSILSDIPADVKVEFITGTGVGVPQMIRRYVESFRGSSKEWDYNRKEPLSDMRDLSFEKDPDSRFSQIRMKNLTDIIPVLVNRQSEVSFLLDPNDKESLVTFKRDDGLKVSAGIVYSVADDTRNMGTLLRGSLMQTSGLPVIHVMENRLEAEQDVNLKFESSQSLSAFVSEHNYEDTLFGEEPRRYWDPEKCTSFSVLVPLDKNESIAIPFVGTIQDSAVYVNNYPFKTVLGAYAALLHKEYGTNDKEIFRQLSNNESSIMSTVGSISFFDGKVSDAVEEKCMRNAVRMMSEASTSFADRLLSTGQSDLLVQSSFGGTRLFTDLQGNGENRFGVVLKAERERLSEQLDVARKNASEEARRLNEENIAMKRRMSTTRARGELMSGGAPSSIEKAGDAVWFLGVDRPLQLALKDGEESFCFWEESPGGEDAATREIIGRKTIKDTDGNEMENNLVFIFPSDTLACTGRRHVNKGPNCRDLTGLMRVNPKTGKEFVCAFGLPVKHNNKYFEFDNKFMMPCSFKLDNDNSDLFNAMVSVDAVARRTALEQGMALCVGVSPNRSFNNSDINDDLSRIFNEKIWDYPRTKGSIDRQTGRETRGGEILPTEVKKRVYDPETMEYSTESKTVYKKQWVPNPHSSPRNKALLKTYEQLLLEGSGMPLNCICLPQKIYKKEDETKFMMHLNLALNIANATAIQLGVPMRFPLDKNGKIYLGEDIPEELRQMAENRILTFINAVTEKNVITDKLDALYRIPIYKAFDKRTPLQKSGHDIYLRPNDLLTTFGQFEFDIAGFEKVSIIGGARMVKPIHEMAFVDEDGTVFKITGTRNSSNISVAEMNKYLRYEKNDEYRYTIKSSDPEKIPAFIITLKSYIERAKKIGVETRLLTAEEANGMNLGTDGYFHLFSSNSNQVPMDEHEISARGQLTSVDVPNRFDGTDNEMEYAGKEDANDAFEGYVQFRYTLPDGTVSGWNTITDRQLARDVIMSSVQRKYRSDIYVVPSKNVLDACIRSEAVKAAGEGFRKLSYKAEKTKTDSKVVQSERYVPETKPVESQAKTMNVYAGARENAELSNLAPRPFKYDVKKFNVKR